MENKEPDYSLELLKDYLYYDDGNLIWKKKITKAKIGTKAGSKCKKRKYIFFSFFNQRTQLHRAIWFYHKGYWPKIIDHIDRDVENNRIENLRECSLNQSLQNRCGKKGSSSIYKGVHITKRPKDGKKYSVAITANKKLIKVGLFETEIEAAKAYNEAAKIHHGEFAYLNEV